MKSLLRNILNSLHIDLSINLKYDRLSKKIIKKELKKNSNCIDIGCHKGEILELLIKQSPQGRHFAFEPIPDFYSELKNKYKEVQVFPYALGEIDQQVEFNFVKNAPAYSGIKKRDYDKIKPDIEKISVQQKKLDDCIPKDVKIDFIKIDVEGGEFGVLKGAKRILHTDKPIILFEFGLGASNYYGTDPKDIYEFFKQHNYNMYTLQEYLNDGQALTLELLIDNYTSNDEYYFVAN